MFSHFYDRHSVRTILINKNGSVRKQTISFVSTLETGFILKTLEVHVLDIYVPLNSETVSADPESNQGM